MKKSKFRMRRKFTPEFKSRIAIEAISGSKTVTELSDIFELNPKQIAAWKSILIKKAHTIFETE